MKTKTVQFSGKKHIKVASATGCKFSKIIVAISLVISCTSCANNRCYEHKNSTTPTQDTEKVESYYYMYFSSEYVAETLHHLSTGYHYIIYNDVDAGLDHELLQVDAETFRRIEAAKNTQKGKMKGYLKEIDGQYTYCHEKD